VTKAEAAINAIINADEETRNAIRNEQLAAAKNMNNTLYGNVSFCLYLTLID
jgi:hypothetical protein